MVCQECGKRQSTLHFTKIINGEKTEYRLCDLCARDKGEMIPGVNNGFSIHNLLSGLLDFESGKNGVGAKTAPQPLRCDTCGLAYAQFSKIGRFGCENCYDQFRHKLDPMLKRIHGSTIHNGKVPVRGGDRITLKREVARLKTLLTEAIENEEFERAAQIRDQLNILEPSRSKEASKRMEGY